jgi:hypothetical protein
MLPPLPSVGAVAPTSPGPPPGPPPTGPPVTDVPAPGVAARSDVPPPLDMRPLRVPQLGGPDLGRGVWTPPPTRPASPYHGTEHHGTGHNGATGKGTTRRNGVTPGGRRHAGVTATPPEVSHAPLDTDRAMTTEPIEFTPGGLPVRRRPATDPTVEVDPPMSPPGGGVFASSLPGRGGRHGVPEPELPEERSGAAVEAMRQRLSAYQRGSRRGRVESADQSADPDERG